MIKGRKIRGIIVAIALIICTAVSVAADSSKGWNIEHKSLEANFYGNVSFSRRNGLFKSVITYFAHIGGTDKDKVQLSVDSDHNAYRKPSDVVGTLMISTKNYHNGNILKKYVAYGHEYNTTQIKDYVRSINVDTQFGTLSSYKMSSFTLE